MGLDAVIDKTYPLEGKSAKRKGVSLRKKGKLLCTHFQIAVTAKYLTVLEDFVSDGKFIKQIPNKSAHLDRIMISQRRDYCIRNSESSYPKSLNPNNASAVFRLQ